MIDEKVCQITVEQLPEADWQAASRAIKPLRGNVFVEMAPAPGSQGVIVLPDNVKDAQWADLGTVVAVGDDVELRPGVPLVPGTRVLVRPTDGTQREGFAAGEYKPINQVRIYGVYCDDSNVGDPTRYAWDRSILAEITEDMEIRPRGDNVLVRMKPLVESDRGIWLPDDSKYRTSEGTVVNIGETVLEVEPGDRVFYNPNAVIQLDWRRRDKDLAILLECGIECAVRE